MDDHDDFLDDILGDDGTEESVGQMLDAVNSSAAHDDDDDSLDGLLASAPNSPVKESKPTVDPNSLSLTEAAAIASGYVEHDDMLDDLLASPAASKSSGTSFPDEEEKVPEQPELGGSKGSFLPKEISDMEAALAGALEPSETHSDDDSEDDLSGVLHGNLDDLDFGDFEAQPEEKAAEEEPPKEPVKVPDAPVAEEKKEKEEEDVNPEVAAPPTPTAAEDKTDFPMSPLTHEGESEFDDDFDAFLDGALDEPAPVPVLAAAPIAVPSKPKSKTKPVPTTTRPKPAKKPPVPKVSRKPAVPKIKPTTSYQHDKPIGDLKKPKKKPLSFLKKKTTPTNGGEKKKSGAKKGFMSTISRWSNRKTEAPKKSTAKKTISSNRSIATSVGTSRSAATHRSTASGRNAMTSSGSICSIVSQTETKSRGSDIIQCGVQFNPFVHGFRAACDLCVHFLSDKETYKFLETGRSPRVMQTRGGCCTDCQVFPRPVSGPGIRLCRQCYYNSHRDVFQKYVQEHEILQTVRT